MSVPERATDPVTHWPAVLAVLAAGTAIAMNAGKVPVALAALRQEFSLTLVQAGWVSSMLTTVAVGLAAVVGMAVGHVGALRMVTAGLLVCAAASLATLAVPGAQGLLLCRLAEGAGFMTVAVASPALISAAAGVADRRFALGLWSAYMPAGASLAMALAPLLLPTLGWRALWVATAAVLLLAALAVHGQRRHYGAPHAPAAGPFFGPVRRALAQPLPWLLACGFGLWATQHFALIVWLPTYLKEQRALPPGTVALLTGVMLVACVPGNLLGGALVQRGVPRGLMLAGAQAGCGLMAWGYSSDALPDALRYALSVGVSFTGGLMPAAVMASSTLLARTPQQIGTLQGLYMQGAQLGQFVGTPLIAAVVSATGDWHSALRVTGGAAAIGVLVGLAAHVLESRLLPKD